MPAAWRFEPNLQWSTRNMGLLPSVMVPRSGAISPFTHEALDQGAVDGAVRAVRPVLARFESVEDDEQFVRLVRELARSI